MPQLSTLLKQNRAAQKRFYEQYKIQMFKLCRMYIKDRHSAEDALQEGFVKIFKSIDTFDVEKGELEKWMRKIFTNTCLSHLRKSKRIISQTVELNTVINVLNQSFDESKFVNLSLKQIHNLLHQLPDGYRSIFIMYFVEGLSHTEIAEHLGITENTSKSQLFKSKKKVQQLIAENFPNEYSKYAKTAQ
jgi:RNA polymerase sigma-70 factor (ECF subfamily)